MSFEHLTEYQREVLHVLRKILGRLDRPVDEIDSFTITQQGDPMALLPIAPGFSPVFTATPVPAAAVPNPATPPVWTSSDVVNFPITSSGLVATAALPASAVVGTTGTLSISYTNADGTVATGSFSWTIVAPPSPDITSFTVAQTA
jgi:hypothetical protein